MTVEFAGAVTSETREIQKSLLPEPAPAWDGLELRCFSRPALEIGGDFYTYRASVNAKVLLSKYVIAVGDVSGKGVSAALLMATALSRFDASLSLRLRSAALCATSKSSASTRCGRSCGRLMPAASLPT